MNGVRQAVAKTWHALKRIVRWLWDGVISAFFEFAFRVIVAAVSRVVRLITNVD